jgi:hypothetical protein
MRKAPREAPGPVDPASRRAEKCAKNLTNEVITVEVGETTARRTLLHNRGMKASPAKNAARYPQLEAKIRAVQAYDIRHSGDNPPTAIIAEATQSFLGWGPPGTPPSPGTPIQAGNGVLFSGERWITILPGTALVIRLLAINVPGHWLRDALDPKLR